MARYRGTARSIGFFVAGLVGVALLTFAGHTTYRNHVARAWPLADGRVVSSRTFLHDESLGRPGDTKVARAEVRFAYDVGGRAYQSTHVSYDRGIGGTAPYLYPAGYAAAYPEGAAVRVAYDPANPAESVVDASRDPYATLAVGIVLTAAFVGYQIWLRGSPTDRGTPRLPMPAAA